MFAHLRRRIFSYIFTTLFLAMMVTGLLSYRIVAGILKDQYTDLAASHLNATFQKASLYFETVRQGSASLTRACAAGTPLPVSSARSLSEGLRGQIDGYLGFSIFDAEGRLIGASSRKASHSLYDRLASAGLKPQLNISDQPIICAVPADVSDLYGVDYFCCAVPLYTNGNPAGYAFLDVGMSDFYFLLQGSQTANFLIDPFVFSSTGSYFEAPCETRLPAPPVTSALTDSRSFFMKKNYLMGQQTFGNGFRVVLALRNTAHTNQLLDMGLLFFAMIFLLSILSAGIARLFGRHITLPLTKLLNRMQTDVE